MRLWFVGLFALVLTDAERRQSVTVRTDRRDLSL